MEIKVYLIETTSGSLAQAPGIASGFAYCSKRDKQNFYTYVILSDGEHYEGQLWETALFASHYKLDNLVFIVDRNKQIILGKNEELLKLEPLDKNGKVLAGMYLTLMDINIQR